MTGEGATIPSEQYLYNFVYCNILRMKIMLPATHYSVVVDARSVEQFPHALPHPVEQHFQMRSSMLRQFASTCVAREGTWQKLLNQIWKTYSSSSH